jgi:uncharacterized protein YpmB
MKAGYGRTSLLIKYKRLIAIAGIIIIASAVFLSVQNDMSRLPSDPEARALAIAEGDRDVVAFKTANPNATHFVDAIDGKAAKESAVKYPVIYGGLPDKTLYGVQYVTESSGTGMFLIVDVDTGQVLKRFETSFMILSK